MSSREEIEKLVQESFAKAEKFCEVPWVAWYERPLPNSDVTLHTIFLIIVGAAGLINLCIGIYLFLGHLLNWTKPREQKQCARIVFFTIFDSLITFFSVVFKNDGFYLDPIAQLYEGFAVIALFLLYVELSRPDNGAPDRAKQSLLPGKEVFATRGVKKGWYRTIWILVFQLIVIRAAAFVASEIIAAKTCPLDANRRTANTVVEVVQGISTILAAVAIIQYERRMREYLIGHRSLFKLVSFKAIILLQSIQNILFSLLAAKKVFFPSYPFYISYNDFAKDLPLVLFMLELTGQAITFLWAFEFKSYRAERRKGVSVAAGPGLAFLATFWFGDVLQGLVYSITGPRSQSMEPSAMRLKNMDSNEPYQQYERVDVREEYE